jgi:hypothetical protein
MGTPFQIKTDSALGSGDEILVHFKDESKEDAGGLRINFGSPMWFELIYCFTGQVTLENVPKEEDKIWTFFRTPEISRIECNGVVLVEYLISSCGNYRKNIWDKEVHYLRFHSVDGASDFIRPIIKAGI